MATLLRQLSPASSQAVWALWADTARWPAWDPAVASVEPVATLSPGLRLRVSTTSGTVTRARITAVTPGEGYVEQARLPLARVLVTRRVLAGPEGSVLTAAVRFAGPLGGAWGLLLSGRVSASVGDTLRAVAKAAGVATAGG